MRVLLHTIVRKSGRNLEDRVTFDDDKLVIGRAVDAGLKIEGMRIAARHAEILRTDDGRFMIVSLVSTGISVNGHRLESAILAQGDTVRVGNYQLLFREDKSEFDFILEIEKVKDESNYDIERVKAYRSTNFLQKTGYGIRAWSWGAVICILVLFLILPILGFSIPQVGQWQRSLLAPFSDLSWDPGPLVRGHQHLGEDCGQCHRSAFLMVNNEACLDCHQAIPHHFDSSILKLSSTHAFECVDCHVQHQGGSVAQARLDDHCVDCHEDIRAFASNSRLEPVTHGFPEGHPQFRAKLIKNDGVKDRLIWATLAERGTQGHELTEVVEESNLYFSHKLHLSPMIVCRSDAQHLCKPEENAGLKCSNCHKPDAAGRNMAPIQFSEHCHECHKLTFEFNTLAPEVPHGDAKLVLSKLNDYFLARALDCAAPEPIPLIPAELRQRPGARIGVEGPMLCAAAGNGASNQPMDAPRQRPGEECLGESRGECVSASCAGDAVSAVTPLTALNTDEPPPIRQLCQGAGVPGGITDTYLLTQAWSAQKAAEVRMGMLYQYRACGQCHVIDGDDIRPVTVNSSWFPKARFAHEAHAAITCQQCHEAEQSETSRDILLKGKDSCGECHGGPGVTHKIASTCSSCHAFHLDRRPPFRLVSRGNGP